LKTLRTICAVVMVAMTGTVMATTVMPGDSSVRYAANMGGFFVNSTGFDLYGATSWASSNMYPGTTPLWGVQAGGPSYSDAGIVLNFDGSLILGQLDSVTINTAASDPGNVTPIVNLWLDSGGDNQFFAFSSDTFTGLAGDSYAGGPAGNINGSSPFYMLGGNGAGGTYTLADLKAGMVSGIGADTKVALWIGVTNGPSYENYNYANITGIKVVPEPATLAILGLGSLVFARKRK
jgi:hypothetical protein